MTEVARTAKDVADCLRLLAPLYSPEDARQWLESPQSLLGGRVPMDLIREGRTGNVRAVLMPLYDSVHI